MKEIRDIHPLVALWLTKNGYSYVHEYKLPDYGRVDFFATHSDGHTLLVEAKGDDLHRVITQLKGYSVQIPDAKLAIAAAPSRISEKIKTIASKYSIHIIETDEPEKREEVLGFDANMELQMIGIRRGVNMLEAIHNPCYITEKIFNWHSTMDSHALLDFFILYGAVGQTPPGAFSEKDVFAAQDVYLKAMVDALNLIISDFDSEEKHGAIMLFEQILLETKGIPSMPRLSGSSYWSDLE